MALGRPAWAEARATLLRLLSVGEGVLRDDAVLRSRALLPRSEVRMHLPAAIGDYTDFYASREHATNIGVMFRGRDNALQPNWWVTGGRPLGALLGVAGCEGRPGCRFIFRAAACISHAAASTLQKHPPAAPGCRLHLPVGYHGRASSIVVSGTDVRRPHGQVVRGAGQPQVPAFEPSAALDYELEVVSGRCGGGRLSNVAFVLFCSLLIGCLVLLVEALCCGDLR